jgi:glycosyltransferase involved in cell wall biosynthesis
VKVLFHDTNKGKGAAIRTAIPHITGDIVIIQDADLEYDPSEYPRLIAPILDGKADVVYGSRFSGEARRVLFFWHAVGNKIITTLSNMLTDLNLSDMETGYKVFRAEVLKKVKIESDRFGFEPEITAKVAKMGCRIYEVSISYWGRNYSEGKKIKWKDGIAAIYWIIKYNLFR